MGKLKINFLSKGENVEDDNFHEYRGYIQRYQRQYHTSTLNELEFDGDDYVINLDVEQLENGINFNDYDYPTQELKDRVLEILNYKNIESEFKNIINSLHSSEFKDRHNIKRLGEKALQLIESTNDSEIFPELKFDRETAADDIRHTLGKEVDILVNYTKPSASTKSKNSDVHDAVKHLVSDINSFIFPLDNLTINNASKN